MTKRERKELADLISQAAGVLFMFSRIENELVNSDGSELLVTDLVADLHFGAAALRGEPPFP